MNFYSCSFISCFILASCFYCSIPDLILLFNSCSYFSFMIFLFYFYFLNLFLLFCCFLTLLFCCWFTSLPGPVLSVLSDVKLGFSSWPVLRVRHASISAYNYFRVISRNLTQPDGEWYHLAATVSCFATPAQNTNRGLFCCICSQFLSSFQVSVG